MSCIFLTKLRGSSGRVKWLRLEQRPFNYFAARTSTARTNTHTHARNRARSHTSLRDALYVRSHLVAGIAKVQPLMHVTVSAYTCPPFLSRFQESFSRESASDCLCFLLQTFEMMIPVFQRLSYFAKILF